MSKKADFNNFRFEGLNYKDASTYASETPDARIVELPELEGKGFAGCHIKL